MTEREWCDQCHCWVDDGKHNAFCPNSPVHPAVGENWIQLAQRGFRQWAEKPHNKRWAKKIDGTPIPNDLPICVGEVFAARISQLEAGLKEIARSRSGHDLDRAEIEPEAYWMVTAMEYRKIARALLKGQS